MRSERELSELVEQLPDPAQLTVEDYTKRFREVCGDCTGEEIRMMVWLCGPKTPQAESLLKIFQPSKGTDSA